MPYRPYTDQNCSIARTLEIVGERWTLLVMREILLGRHRFAEIQRNVGLAANILADRLGGLVDHGLLTRSRYSEQPEAHEYVATSKGLEIAPVLAALLAWGDRHAAPPAGPPRVLVHTTCAHDAHPRLCCGHCGMAIDAAELAVRPGPGSDARQRDEPHLPLVAHA